MSLSKRFLPTVLSAIVVTHLAAASANAFDPPTSARVQSQADSLDLLVVSKNGCAIVPIVITLDGEPLSRVRRSMFAALFQDADQDGDNALSPTEAGNLPSAFALRQGAPFLNPGYAPEWSSLDIHQDNRVDRDETVAYYCRQALGGAQIGGGCPLASSSSALSEAIWKHLDVHADGRLTDAESLAVASSLTALDENGDELISPAELTTRSSRPDALGAVRLVAPSADREPTFFETEFPVIPLPENLSDRRWAENLFHRRDANADGRWDATEAGFPRADFARLDASGDQSLSCEELADWRTQPNPNLHSFELGAAPTFGQSELITAGVRLVIRSTEGDHPARINAFEKRLHAQFAEADANNDQHVDAGESVAPALAELRKILPQADRNRDGKLSAEELDRRLALQRRIAASFVIITVIDHGKSIFGCLDADADGALSLRELGLIRSRLRNAGVLNSDDVLDRGNTPRLLVITVSRGLPQTVYQPIRPGPPWFRAMDRNRDGDVSKREFQGPADLFTSLDTNKDGLFSAQESLSVSFDPKTKSQAP